MALLAVAVCFAAAYALYGLFRHWHYDSSAYDMGIFDQVVWHLSRFEAPASTVRGVSNLLLGDHFFPVVILFAPLYWIRPGPEALIIAQAVLFAASIPLVYVFARGRLPHAPSLALAVAYGCFWGLQRAAAFDVHEAAFAPLAVAAAILAADRRRWTTLWLACGAMVLIKEDLIPLIGTLGIYLLARGERRQGGWLLVASVAALVLVVGIIVPAYNDGSVYEYRSAYQPILSRPWTIPATLVTPSTKVVTAVLWFLPFLFVSLASPLSLLVVPFALSRFLSISPNHWGTVFHYSAPIAPIVAMAAADGLARIAGTQRPRLVTAIAAACVVASALVPGRQPLWRVLAPTHYRASPAQAVGDRLVAMVPANASVVAQAAIVPHLTMRQQMYVLTESAPDADYVLMSDALSPWPSASVGELAAMVEARRARGYHVIASDHGWTMLHR